MKTYGIDVSRYQKEIDWEKVKASGVQFAMLKTVSTNSHFGGLYIDPYFERNYAECKRLGIPVGAYYYTYAQSKAYADKELTLFKKAITGKQFEYPLCVDVEDNRLKPLSADALTDLVIHAVEIIESWHCFAQVYTYTSYKNTELNMKRLTEYDLWIADYRGKEPSVSHGMWQYTSKGKVDGIDGNCDLNYAYVDYPTIIKKKKLNGFGEEIPVPPIPRPDPPKEKFLPPRGYFAYGDKSDKIGMIAKFMYKNYPLYTKKRALGNYFGPYLLEAIKEFQNRSKDKNGKALKPDGFIGPLTLDALERAGFKH